MAEYVIPYFMVYFANVHDDKNDFQRTLTRLKESCVRRRFPKPQITTGCWVTLITNGNTRWVRIGNRYHSFWLMALSISSKRVYIISPKWQNTNIVQNDQKSKMIGRIISMRPPSPWSLKFKKKKIFVNCGILNGSADSCDTQPFPIEPLKVSCKLLKDTMKTPPLYKTHKYPRIHWRI